MVADNIKTITIVKEQVGLFEQKEGLSKEDVKVKYDTLSEDLFNSTDYVIIQEEKSLLDRDLF